MHVIIALLTRSRLPPARPNRVQASECPSNTISTVSSPAGSDVAGIITGLVTVSGVCTALNSVPHVHSKVFHQSLRAVTFKLL